MNQFVRYDTSWKSKTPVGEGLVTEHQKCSKVIFSTRGDVWKPPNKAQSFLFQYPGGSLVLDCSFIYWCGTSRQLPANAVLLWTASNSERALWSGAASWRAVCRRQMQGRDLAGLEGKARYPCYELPDQWQYSRSLTLLLPSQIKSSLQNSRTKITEDEWTRVKGTMAGNETLKKFDFFWKSVTECVVLKAPM